MNTVLRKLGLIALLALAILIGRVVFSTITQDLTTVVQEQLTELKLPCSVSAARLAFPAGFNADELNCTLRLDGAELPIVINNLSGRVRLLPLALLKFRVSLGGELLEGNFEANLERPLLLASDQKVDILMTGINVGAHPLARPYGIKGSLSGDGKLKFPFNGGRFALPTEASIALTLNQVSYPGGRISVVNLPAVTSGQMAVRMEGKGEEFKFSQLSSESNLGKVTGNAQLTAPNVNRVTKLNGELRINLTEDGKRSFGGYLALAANSDVAKPASKWKVDLGLDKQGKVRPKVTVRGAE